MTDREKQIKALLESYCEWCKDQGGHCQAKLDGCSIADIKALLAEPESQGIIEEETDRVLIRNKASQEPASEFVDWWETQEGRKEACDRLEAMNADLLRMTNNRNYFEKETERLTEIIEAYRKTLGE